MSIQRNLQIVIAGRGGPEVLKLVEEELPQPGAGEVRVRVLATGVAFADILMRHGLYPKTPPFPFAPGYDIVGEIDALGDGVHNFHVGQRVAALTMIGGYSQLTVVPAKHLVPVPDGARSCRGCQPGPQLRHRVPDASSRDATSCWRLDSHS